jgi:hypothetical protein
MKTKKNNFCDENLDRELSYCMGTKLNDKEEILFNIDDKMKEKKMKKIKNLRFL